MKSFRRPSWRAFWRSTEGSSLVEFALLLPVLLIMLMGGVTIEEAGVVSHKVVATAHSLVNVTSQYTAVTTTDLTNILTASQLVMEPYPGQDARLIVSEVQIAAGSSVATVVWSQALNTTARAVGSSVSVPASDLSDDASTTTTYMIYGEVLYTFTPRVAASYLPTLHMQTNLFTTPRHSDSIPLQTDSSG